MSKHATAQERGHLYPAELPTFQKGETGKGASVKMTGNPAGGTPLKTGGDKYMAQLKSTWNKAVNAATKFPKGF